MSSWLLFGLLTASVVVPASLAAQADRASGRLTIDGDTVVLRHVLARRVAPMFDKDKLVTQVLITAQPVPTEALEDDAWALIVAVRENKVTGLQLEYEDGGRSVTAKFLSSRLTGSVSVSRSGTSAVPTELTATRVAGTFEANTTSLEDYAVAVTATWSARVQPKAVVAEPTAADAAAALEHPAVKAWQAIARAIHAGDKAALLAVAPASIKSMASQPDFDAGFAGMKEMTPIVSRYLRVTERNGKVIIEAEAPGLMDKKTKRGTITMVRDGAVWWVETMSF